MISLPSWKEAFFVFVAIAALILAQLRLVGSLSLFTHLFWLDEIITSTLVRDPDFSHTFEAVRAGVDTNPPGLYWMLRVFCLFTGGPSDFSLHLFSFLSIVLSLAGIYLILRRAYSPAVCALCVLTLWAHPLIVWYAFDARFYGPWMAAIVWYIVFLTRAHTRPTIGNLIGTTVCAVVTCMVHYFGVISLACVTVADFVFFSPKRYLSWRFLLPGATAVMALMAWSPIYLQQKKAFTVATWLPDNNLLDVGTLIFDLFSGYLFFLVLFAWGSQFVGARNAIHDVPTHSHGALAGLAGLMLLLPALVAVSALIQPVIYSRYFLPVVAGLAPVVAFSAARLTRPMFWGACAALAIWSSLAVMQIGAVHRECNEDIRGLIGFVREKTDSVFAFDTTGAQFILWHYAPETTSRCVYVDFETHQLPEKSNFKTFVRDLYRAWHRYYPDPPSKSVGEFQTLDRFYLVYHERKNELPHYKYLPAFFPNHDWKLIRKYIIEPFNDFYLFELKRKT